MIFRIPIFILFFTSTLFGQTCDSFGFMKKGTQIEMSSFDSKGKLVSKATSKVLDLINTGGNLEAKMDTKNINDKGKETFSGVASVLCNGSNVSFSMKNMMLNDQLAGMKGMEMKIDETMLDYPNNIIVGSSLKDGSFKAEMYSGGMRLMTLNFNITNRKVVAEENLNTPAGSFNCYKITYSGNMKTIVNMNFEVTEWYSPRIGLVKSETTRNGKAMGYTQVTQANVN